MPRLSITLVMGVIIAALIAGFLIVGPQACSSIFTAKKRAELATEQQKATTNNAKDAIATIGNSAAAERASEELTRRNEEEIRNAKGADQPVDPAVRDAGLDSLCRRPAYSRSERCLQRAAPR